MYKCRVCGEENPIETTQCIELINVRQDVNSKFEYFRCSYCESIQIIDIPDNLAEYYNNDTYYSFGSKKSDSGLTFIKKKIKPLIMGTVVYRRIKRDWLGATEEKLRNIKELDFNNKKQKILDVGCGSGDFLNKLRCIGFKNVLGVDPFISEDFETENGVLIKSVTADKVEGKWDQIWMIHSYEHVVDPLETLKAVSKKLAEDGVLIMELPICDSYEYEKYGKYWTGCDAPVHIVMHTKKGLEILLKKTGLKLVNVYNFASDDFLKLSEMTKRGYSLNEVDSEKIKSVLGAEKLDELRKIMEKINEEKKSGLVTYIIKKDK